MNYHAEVCSDCLTCQDALAAERQRADNATDWGRKLFAACEEAGQRWAAISQRAERLEAALRGLLACMSLKHRCSGGMGFGAEEKIQAIEAAEGAIKSVRMAESNDPESPDGSALPPWTCNHCSFAANEPPEIFCRVCGHLDTAKPASANELEPKE